MTSNEGVLMSSHQYREVWGDARTPFGSLVDTELKNFMQLFPSYGFGFMLVFPNLGPVLTRIVRYQSEISHLGCFYISNNFYNAIVVCWRTSLSQPGFREWELFGDNSLNYRHLHACMNNTVERCARRKAFIASMGRRANEMSNKSLVQSYPLRSFPEYAPEIQGVATTAWEDMEGMPPLECLLTEEELQEVQERAKAEDAQKKKLIDSVPEVPVHVPVVPVSAPFKPVVDNFRINFSRIRSAEFYANNPPPPPHPPTVSLYPYQTSSNRFRTPPPPPHPPTVPLYPYQTSSNRFRTPPPPPHPPTVPLYPYQTSSNRFRTPPPRIYGDTNTFNTALQPPDILIVTPTGDRRNVTGVLDCSRSSLFVFNINTPILAGSQIMIEQHLVNQLNVHANEFRPNRRGAPFGRGRPFFTRPNFRYPRGTVNMALRNPYSSLPCIIMPDELEEIMVSALRPYHSPESNPVEAIFHINRDCPETILKPEPTEPFESSDPSISSNAELMELSFSSSRSDNKSVIIVEHALIHETPEERKQKNKLVKIMVKRPIVKKLDFDFDWIETVHEPIAQVEKSLNMNEHAQLLSEKLTNLLKSRGSEPVDVTVAHSLMEDHGDTVDVAEEPIPDASSEVTRKKSPSENDNRMEQVDSWDVWDTHSEMFTKSWNVEDASDFILNISSSSDDNTGASVESGFDEIKHHTKRAETNDDIKPVVEAEVMCDQLINDVATASVGANMKVAQAATSNLKAIVEAQELEKVKVHGIIFEIMEDILNNVCKVTDVDCRGSLIPSVVETLKINESTIGQPEKSELISGAAETNDDIKPVVEAEVMCDQLINNGATASVGANMKVAQAETSNLKAIVEAQELEKVKVPGIIFEIMEDILNNVCKVTDVDCRGILIPSVVETLKINESTNGQPEKSELISGAAETNDDIKPVVEAEVMCDQLINNGATASVGANMKVSQAATSNLMAIIEAQELEKVKVHGIISEIMEDILNNVCKVPDEDCRGSLIPSVVDTLKINESTIGRPEKSELILGAIDENLKLEEELELDSLAAKRARLINELNEIGKMKSQAESRISKKSSQKAQSRAEKSSKSQGHVNNGSITERPEIKQSKSEHEEMLIDNLLSKIFTGPQNNQLRYYIFSNEEFQMLCSVMYRKADPTSSTAANFEESQQLLKKNTVDSDSEAFDDTSSGSDAVNITLESPAKVEDVYDLLKLQAPCERAENPASEVIERTCPNVELNRDLEADPIKDGENNLTNWDKIFTPEGHLELTCLNQIHRMTRLKVVIVKAMQDYSKYQYPWTMNMSHILELRAFPKMFTTTHILQAFRLVHSEPMYIKWCDDTHALLILSSPEHAERALRLRQTSMQVNKLLYADAVSILIAGRCDLRPAVRHCPETEKFYNV